MISTAWDYAIFCQMFLNGGVYHGIRLLKPETVKLMTSPQTAAIQRPPGAPEGPGTYYGYGWMVREDGVYSHGGSDGTFAWVDPENRVIGLVFTQTPRGRNPRAQFMELVRPAVRGR